jgi:hypothetical protein
MLLTFSHSINMKKIGVVGSRRRNTPLDYLLVKEKIESLIKEYKEIILVSGGCPKGADSFVVPLSKDFNLPVPTIFYPDWSKGRFAGLERNTLIAQESDILIAVVASDRTGGTEDTIKKFLKFHPEGKLTLL